jgi:hypothetical protein
MEHQLLGDEIPIEVERFVWQRREHNADRARLDEDERDPIGARR